jgi:hypothetical protein
MRWLGSSVLAATLAWPALVLPVPGSAADQATAHAGAKTWIGRAAEIEKYLRTAPIVRQEKTDRGVTRPVRAFFAPGGVIESMTWKALPPGRPNGYYESYKSEIAAYEIDKMLALNMVPPKVERELDGQTGVAVMWVSGARTFSELRGVPKPPPQKAAKFNGQLARAKMFHNLIGDIDPNLGNWLVDSEWNVILIDQSRALTETTDMVHTMQSIDHPLWQRMRALTEDRLQARLSPWLDAGQIRAILSRRDRLQKEVERLDRQSPR